MAHGMEFSFNSGFIRPERKANVGYLYERPQAYRMLSDDRRSRIERIGRDFRPAKETGDAHWRTMYQRVSRFVERHGRLPAQTRQPGAEYRLNTWLVRQKWLHQNGRLEPRRLTLLRRLHPLLDDFEAWCTSGVEKQDLQWHRKWAETKAIIEATGYYPTQVSTDRTEVNPAGWFLRERTKLRDGRLDQRRSTLLRRLVDMGRRRKPNSRQQNME